jgi:hypothetical protein
MGEVPITRAAVRRIAVLRWAWVVALLAGGWIVRGAGSGSMLLAGRVLVAVAGVLWLLAPWVTVEGAWIPRWHRGVVRRPRGVQKLGRAR